jgi:tetratricopeptide (TPR) repeat protein
MENIYWAVNAAVDAISFNDPDRATKSITIANRLGARFERTGAIDDLNCAIEVAEMAIAASPEDHPNRPSILNDFGVWLYKKFEQTRVISDLNHAVEVAELAVEAAPQNHPHRVSMLNDLGVWRSIQFEQTGVMDNLNRAIELANVVIEAIDQDHLYFAVILSNVQIWLGWRYEGTGSMDDLNRIVDVLKLAVDAAALGDPDRLSGLNDLGCWLYKRFERTRVVDDLNRAVEAAELAVEAAPQSHTRRVDMLNNLGLWLARRFEETAEIDDINYAIDVTTTVIEATPQGHPDQALRETTFGNCLGLRFGRTGVISDLNRAIEAAELAVQARPRDHPDHPRMLNNLGTWLYTRFERTGAMDDLNRAIEVSGLAVQSTPQDHPDRSGRFSNLGIWLSRRFERTGAMDDINRAIEAAEIAVQATPQDNLNLSKRIDNLGNCFGWRYTRTGAIEDLNRAVKAAEMAAELTSNRPNHASCLNNLGIWLSRRFERTGVKDDLDRAIEVAGLAVELTPRDHPDLPSRLSNLGLCLNIRFEQTEAMDDLNRAIEADDMAIEALPFDHPGRALVLGNLASYLHTRHKRTRTIDDLKRSLSCFTEGWNSENTQPSIRIRLALNAAAILASLSNWEDSSRLLEDAVKLLPTVSPRSIQHTDKQHMLADFASIACSAAAIALNAKKEPYYALKLLELGRGVIAGLLLEMRTDVSELEQKHLKLAKEFISLRDELDLPTDTTGVLTTVRELSSIESQAKRRREAERRLQEVLEEIRSKEGFKNFLLPPTLDELTTAANDGTIVVVNVSSYRCDAFLVRQSQPVTVLELPKLLLEDIEEISKSLRTADQYGVQQTLVWLWDVVASPILDVLGFKQTPYGDNWPHIWWIPTGQLSQLPIHAAGQHSNGSDNTVLDRVMSSYSPTIKALVFGRRRRRASVQQEPEHALLVTVPGAGLPFSLDEVKMVENMCLSLNLNPVRPPPRRGEILAHLRACKIFHFASHGRSNPLEPSESCLVLDSEDKNNSVTVADLRDCKLQENPPFLAYLSACSTKLNEANRLLDEEIHLVSACQLAGFRHVVGTLWEVSDKYCVEVARVLYETIKNDGMTDRAVYTGLHRAVRVLRDKGVDVVESKEAMYVDGSVKVGGDERIEQKGEGKPSGDADKPRQSHWGTAGGSSQLSSPLLWAAYIHVGL